MSKKKYRIMAFDGGGIRGVLSATILKRLEIENKKLIKSTDLFAGTSTGSFIALGLAYGLPVKEILNLYSMINCRYIFSPKYNELFRPKYNNKHLKEVLMRVFPKNLKLKDLKKKVLIPSFEVISKDNGSWKPMFYTNFEEMGTDNEYVIDVALYSSAAPVYFPSYKKHIDGGIIANNPSLASICVSKNVNGANKKLEDMRILSIGTGFNHNNIKADTRKWGAIEWGLSQNPPYPLLSILFDGNMDADSYYSRELLRDNFLRVNPQISKSIDLDDCKEIPYLINIANSYDIKFVNDWINNKWF
ncbi:patatin-like phospholipase family protein [Tepidibacter aestuarii]|uniref:patatin-like phospholipase family protein n=1 Tax=Tepidibacter aestuarii TaxID=2925782 RepID=UPI0020C087E1|nr:patatin-like phospholipase family protein [Tepidibacter aestuarii]CAH2212669.1 Patatin-like phospholipase/acyl hydrolase [Tepidibacter aestuarii]